MPGAAELGRRLLEEREVCVRVRVRVRWGWRLGVWSSRWLGPSEFLGDAVLLIRRVGDVEGGLYMCGNASWVLGAMGDSLGSEKRARRCLRAVFRLALISNVGTDCISVYS
jgi:hypothetical protein